MLNDVERQELATLLLRAGERLSSSARRKIHSHGIAAVPALLAVVEDRTLFMADAPGDGWAPVHAIRLLGELKAEQAIEPMLAALEESDSLDIAYSALLHSLKQFGPAALFPALNRYESTTDREYRRALGCVLAEAGALDDRVLEILLDQLEDDPELAAGNLAIYGDPRAIPDLSRALDKCTVQGGGLLADQCVIELVAAIEDLGGTLSESQRTKIERITRNRNRYRSQLNSALEMAAATHDLPDISIPRTAATKEKPPGRNDRCWCGSGRKYKKCHLDSDRNS